MKFNRRSKGISPIFVIVLTVFIDVTGFGIIIPLLPFYANEFQAGPTALSVAIPPIIREKSSIRYELAKENIVKLIKEIKSEISNIGFLPCLSDAFPNSGEKKNCIIAKEAIKIPRAAGPA